MKRNRIYFALLAAAMVLPLSCAKDITEVIESDNSSSKDYEGISVEFTTAFTKTAIGEVADGEASVLWEKGDTIKVMGYYTAVTETDGATTTEEKQFCVTATASDDGASATFTADIPVNATDIYAVYPAAACSALTKDDDGNVSVPVKINQKNLTTKFKDAHFCVAKTTLAEKTLLFKNVASVLAFEIKDPDSFATLDKSHLDRPQLMPLNFQAVLGTVPVSFDAEGSVVLGTPVSTANSLDMGNDFASATLTTGTHYLALLPANYTEGFALNLNYYANPACIYSKAADLSTPKILNIGVVDGKFQDNFYVTVAGAGAKTGADWANAMGRDEFVKALARKTEDNSNENEKDNLALARFLQIWKLKGSTFHLGAGTYILGDESSNGLEVNFQGGNGTSYCTIGILGGYPEAGGDTRDAKTNVTKFSGNKQYHILTVKDRARLNIDGITFCDAYFAGECKNGAAKMGAALFLTDSFANTNTDANRTNQAKGAARVSLTNCIFENNRNASANSVTIKTDEKTGKTTTTPNTFYGGGSAIAIQKGYLYANGCKFLNNYDAGYVGCVATCGDYDYENLKSELFFNACLFEGNTTGAGNWGAGHVVSHSTKGILLGMYNCTFHANDGAADNGGYYNTNVIDVRRSSIIANTTIYQATCASVASTQSANDWSGYSVRVDGACSGLNRQIFANNVFQSIKNRNNAGDNRSLSLALAYSTSHDGKVFLKGNNVLSRVVGDNVTEDTGMKVTWDDEALLVNDGETRSTSTKILGMTWNGGLGVFEWNGDETRYTNMSLAKMIEILKSPDLENTNPKFKWGTDFYDWLVEIDALDKDALGNTRPAEGWLAGSYQQN